MVNCFTLNTEYALMQRLAKQRNIALWDFSRLHDECLTYINSIKNGYTAKVYNQYKEFLNSWNGGTNFNSVNIKKALAFNQEQIQEMNQFANSETRKNLNNVLMSVMRDKVHAELIKKNSVLDSLIREYVNSAYNYTNIELTLGTWLEMQLSDLQESTTLLTKLNALTPQEARQKYLFTREDIDSVNDLFVAHKDENLTDVLKLITPFLQTESKERAYICVLMSILSAYTSDIDVEVYWYKVVLKTYEWRKEMAEQDAMLY